MTWWGEFAYMAGWADEGGGGKDWASWVRATCMLLQRAAVGEEVEMAVVLASWAGVGVKGRHRGGACMCARCRRALRQLAPRPPPLLSPPLPHA